MISVENLTVRFKRDEREFTALSSINVSINKSEIFCAVGPSGCGKSTLLYSICGLIKNYDGDILINNHNIKSIKPNVGLVLQEYGLFAWKTVFQNVEIGLCINKISKSERNDRVLKILEDFNLLNIKDSYPAKLSGGQKQRVAICRALIFNPDIILMDEPFSALDAINRENMQNFVLNLWKRTKSTILLVTHSVEEAVFLGNKIVVFSKSPGRIIEQFDIENDKDDNWRFNPQFNILCRDIKGILKGGFSDENEESI